MSKIQQILTIIASMSLAEFREFVKKLDLSTYNIGMLFGDLDNLPNVVPVAPAFGENHDHHYTVDLLASGINGKTIQAIKLYREHTGKGLKDSKDEIDRIRQFDSYSVLAENLPAYLAYAMQSYWKGEGIDLVVRSQKVQF